MSTKETTRIAPADGKLGILIPGIGAVGTTFMAGVEAVKRGLGEPIGSLTQLGTVRLGKRTDARTPRIQDFVPLATLDDLVFGGWDIFEDSAYEAAVHAKVLEPTLLEKLKDPLHAIKPMKAVFDPEYIKRITGPNVKDRGSKMDKAEMPGVSPVFALNLLLLRPVSRSQTLTELSRLPAKAYLPSGE